MFWLSKSLARSRHSLVISTPAASSIVSVTVDPAGWPGLKEDPIAPPAQRRQPEKVLLAHLADLPHCQQFSFLALVQVLPAWRPAASKQGPGSGERRKVERVQRRRNVR